MHQGKLYMYKVTNWQHADLIRVNVLLYSIAIKTFWYHSLLKKLDRG